MEKVKIRKQNEDNEPVHLLWTGGWDSTFRLLQLAVVLKKRVQPHYIIWSALFGHPENILRGRLNEHSPIPLATLPLHRNSLQAEMSAMEQIKKEMFEKYPYTKELVLPTIYAHMSDIPEYPEVRATIDELMISVGFYGPQYRVLGEYAHWKQIPSMELCVESPHKLFSENEKFLVRVETEVDHWYVFDTDQIPESPCRGFSFAKFPVMGETKVTMKEKAKAYNFTDIMWKTWFCFQPQKTKTGLIPCGVCTSCRQTIDNGMEDRVAWTNRMIGWWVWKIQWQFVKLRRFFKRNNKKL